MQADIDYINSLIGIEISGEDMVNLLKKSRFSASLDGNIINVRVPSYRMDVLHPADIAEEIGIAYGYDRLEPELPKEPTFGARRKGYHLEKALKEIMIGLGFNEINTLSLTNDEMQFQRMRMEKGDVVRIKNPITEYYTSVRAWILPSVMDILSKNRHRDLPQRVFELGEVVSEDGKNMTHIAGAIMEDKASFTMIKSIIYAIFRDTGLEIEISEKEHPSFISGRCASIRFRGKEIGFFGEIHPEVLMNFELEHPVSVFEFSIEDVVER